MKNDYSKYEDKKELDTNDTTVKLNQEIEALVLAAKKVAECEDALRRAQKSYAAIADYRIPELMEAAGYTEGGVHTVRDGLSVKWIRAIRASIPVARKSEAYRWLDDNGHGGMIKRSFIISFGRDDEKWAAKFARDLMQRKKPVPLERKDKVEPSTLKAFVKDQLQEGSDLPLDLFGVHMMPTTKIV